jgi:V8-like Glu-specific endopeptidase
MRDAIVVAGACLFILACEPSQPFSSLDSRTGAIINDDDDRRDYFELQGDAPRKAAEFTVALVRAFDARKLVQRRIPSIPTWGELNFLCPDERFEDQTSAAFCSGVLVEADLVLTARHCIDLIAVADARVVFDYYFASPNDVAVGEDDVYEIREIVAKSGVAKDETLDFAWLRLTRSVFPTRNAVPLRGTAGRLALGDSILVVGAAGGTPLKWDQGGRVSELRTEQDDYFVATADTFQGSSGGPALDANMILLGILGRGLSDFERSDAGCRTAARRDTAREGGSEQFTHVHRAVAALCQVAPNRPLCATACGELCRDAMERSSSSTPPAKAPAGCSTTPRADTSGRWGAMAFAGLALLVARISLAPKR